MVIVKEKISVTRLKEMAQNMFGNLVKEDPERRERIIKIVNKLLIEK